MKETTPTSACLEASREVVEQLSGQIVTAKDSFPKVLDFTGQRGDPAKALIHVNDTLFSLVSLGGVSKDALDLAVADILRKDPDTITDDGLLSPTEQIALQWRNEMLKRLPQILKAGMEG